jgi:WD40 repeat protein
MYLTYAVQGHDGPIMAMACQASGGLLATAGAEKKVCVWDVDGGFCTHFLRGHRPYRRCDDHYVPQRSKKSSGEDNFLKIRNCAFIELDR